MEALREGLLSTAWRIRQLPANRTPEVGFMTGFGGTHNKPACADACSVENPRPGDLSGSGVFDAGSVIYRHLVGNAQAVHAIGQDENFRIAFTGQEFKLDHEAGGFGLVNDFDLEVA